MKVGDIIFYHNRWVVVEEMGFAYARIRFIRNYDYEFGFCICDHSWDYMSIGDYYEEKNFLLSRKYKICEFLEDFWGIVIYDWRNVVVFLLLIFFIFILIHSILSIIGIL